MTAATLSVPRRLPAGDYLHLALVGLRTRRLRATLSALGIAIGVAAIVAVLGLAASSQARLIAEINALGTNLLTVQNGESLSGQTAELPKAAPAMIGRIAGVQQVQSTGSVSAYVYRSRLVSLVSPFETNAISVEAASLGLLQALHTTMAEGRFLNAATERYPTAVLGWAAARRLGIDRVFSGERIWVGGRWFYVGGIVRPALHFSELDASVLVGVPAAERYLGFDGRPSTVYVRAETSEVTSVQALLAPTANPKAPYEVDVSQPSAALEAEAEAKAALNSLLLGLGAISLVVGAVGVANIMLIGVLERRSEIGLRRALGATRGQIRTQFLSEAILLGALGGAVGVIFGAAGTAVYASTKGWAIVVPVLAWGGGLGAALLIGAVAGLLPALRAARLSPAVALWTV